MAQQLSVVVGITGGLIAPCALLAAWVARAASVPSGQVAEAADELARAQLELWSKEEGARQIDVPWPLPVRWDVTARTVAIMASWSAIGVTRGAGPIPLAGEFKNVADMFTPGSPRPLVILGEGGAGKTELVLRLLLDLLERRGIADPVPVLLSVAGWNPRRPLEEWIADQLAVSHRWLGAPVNPAQGHTRTLAAALLADGRVLPVLDGMDEMASAHHADAVAAIGRFLTRRRQIVLTCGTAVYADAVAVAGPLTRTPVVEILPLAMSDVTAYLTDATQPANARWQTVVGAGWYARRAASTSSDASDRATSMPGAYLDPFDVPHKGRLQLGRRPLCGRRCPADSRRHGRDGVSTPCGHRRSS